jgi:hypothetical protein
LITCRYSAYALADVLTRPLVAANTTLDYGQLFNHTKPDKALPLDSLDVYAMMPPKTCNENCTGLLREWVKQGALRIGSNVDALHQAATRFSR